MAQHTVPANELAIKALRCPEGKARIVYHVDGHGNEGLKLYVESSGRTLLYFTDDTDTLDSDVKALADAVHSGSLGAMSVERAVGEAVRSAPLRDALTAAGFRATPRGLRLRG